MRCTPREKDLVIRQLRRARDEVLRAKLMMEAIATEEDDEAVEALDDMANDLTVQIATVVKAERMDDEDYEAEEQ
jgi:hypothetical protein